MLIGVGPDTDRHAKLLIDLAEEGSTLNAYSHSGCFPMFRLLENDGVLLHIGGRALDLLLVLAERPGEVVKRFPVQA